MDRHNTHNVPAVRIMQRAVGEARSRFSRPPPPPEMERIREQIRDIEYRLQLLENKIEIQKESNHATDRGST